MVRLGDRSPLLRRQCGDRRLRPAARAQRREFFLGPQPAVLAGRHLHGSDDVCRRHALAVTELVAKHGIAGNWLWWNMVWRRGNRVLFARFWRRAGISPMLNWSRFGIGQAGGIAPRCARALPRPVHQLRNHGAGQPSPWPPFEGMLGVPHDRYWWVGGAWRSRGYSALSGLWGVAVTDVFRFVLAWPARRCSRLSWWDCRRWVALRASKRPRWAFRMTPAIGAAADASSVGGALMLSAACVFAFVGIQWWASWYLVAEPGGAGLSHSSGVGANGGTRCLPHSGSITTVRPWPGSSPDWPPGPIRSRPDAKRLDCVRDAGLPPGLQGVLVASFSPRHTDNRDAAQRGASYADQRRIPAVWPTITRPAELVRM